MPRSSRGRAAPAPAARSAPAAAPAQTRGAHTAAAPAGYNAPASAAHPPAPPPAAAAHAAPAQASQGPGMLAQMAATAGSVAIGSTIGHGLSSMLFGGSSSSSAPVESQAAPVQQQQQSFQSSAHCEVQAKDFSKCLEKADLPSCQWYLDQLKACQAAAAPY